MKIKKTVTIDTSPELQTLCDLLGITPDIIINQYLKDLLSLWGSGSSDERQMSKDYFKRGAMSFEQFEKVEDFLDRLYPRNDEAGRLESINNLRERYGLKPLR